MLDKVWKFNHIAILLDNHLKTKHILAVLLTFMGILIHKSVARQRQLNLINKLQLYTVIFAFNDCKSQNLFSNQNFKHPSVFIQVAPHSAIESTRRDLLVVKNRNCKILNLFVSIRYLNYKILQIVKQNKPFCAGQKLGSQNFLTLQFR